MRIIKHKLSFICQLCFNKLLN